MLQEVDYVATSFKFYLPVQILFTCCCKTANALKRLKNTHREKTSSNKLQ